MDVILVLSRSIVSIVFIPLNVLITFNITMNTSQSQNQIFVAFSCLSINIDTTFHSVTSNIVSTVNLHVHIDMFVLILRCAHEF